MNTDSPRSPSRIRLVRLARRHYLPILVILALLCSVGLFEIGRASVYYAHPELSGQEQAAQVLKKVGQLIQIPGNETPSMATITDAASLKAQQPFLANAQNGDVLIVYTDAQLALLYRPSQDKLIAVGPVTSGTTPDTAATAPIQAPARPSPAATSATTSGTHATTTP